MKIMVVELATASGCCQTLVELVELLVRIIYS